MIITVFRSRLMPGVREEFRIQHPSMQLGTGIQIQT